MPAQDPPATERTAQSPGGAGTKAPPPALPAASAQAAPARVRDSEPVVLVAELFFEPGSAEMTRETRRQVREAAGSFLAGQAGATPAVLVVSGHADTTSDGTAAAQLAGQRAGAVRAALLEEGVPAASLHLRIPGASEPRYGGTALARNARVELQRLTSGRLAPVDANPAGSTVQGKRLWLPFPRYSAMLDVSGATALERLAASVREPGGSSRLSIVLTGAISRDETGSAAHRLGISRAAAVRAYLISIGIGRDAIVTAPGTTDSPEAGGVDVRLVRR